MSTSFPQPITKTVLLSLANLINQLSYCICSNFRRHFIMFKIQKLDAVAGTVVSQQDWTIFLCGLCMTSFCICTSSFCANLLRWTKQWTDPW